MPTPWPWFLVIAATLVGAYASGRFIGRRFGMSEETQLWIAFACLAIALLIEGIIYGRFGYSLLAGSY